MYTVQAISCRPSTVDPDLLSGDGVQDLQEYRSNAGKMSYEDHADYTAPTVQHELDHIDPAHQESIYPEGSRPSTGNR